MENDMEWKGKYKSELLMVIHQDVQAMHEVGAVSDKEMREFDQGCLVSPPRKTRRSKGTAIAQKSAIVYASPGQPTPSKNQ
jgi:DNA-binding transcriptional regulator YiaG